MKNSRSIALLFFAFISLALAMSAVAKTAPTVGRKAAEPYFKKDVEPVEESNVRRRPASDGSHVLMLHLGRYVGSQAYQWKESGKQENVGKVSYGLTYLADEWFGMDGNIRVDFNEFDVNGTRASKLSLLPLITFPRAETLFPLYFGLGAGVGVFFTQVENESTLSLDYQLVAGARFMELAETNAGFFFEFGMKNHLHLLSDGQLNGTVVTAGAIFNF